MGFKYNGQHSDQFGIVAQTKNNPFLPSVKTITYNPQFRDGSIDYSAMENRKFYEDKNIEVLLQVKADNIEILHEKCRNIAKWLSEDGELIFDETPYKTYSAKVEQSVDFAPDFYGKYAEMTVYFRTSPFAFGEEVTVTAQVEANIAKNITISNVGDVSVYPTVYIDGSDSGNIYIGNFSYNGDLSSLKIDMQRKSVIKSGTDITYKSNLNFISLSPSQKSISVQSTADCTVKIVYQPLYF